MSEALILVFSVQEDIGLCFILFFFVFFLLGIQRSLHLVTVFQVRIILTFTLCAADFLEKHV